MCSWEQARKQNVFSPFTVLFNDSPRISKYRNRDSSGAVPSFMFSFMLSISLLLGRCGGRPSTVAVLWVGSCVPQHMGGLEFSI